ncbi:AI-2E family transporter [Geomicrobium sediminis]|uniref:PurR-regulated permease PerM n=1 Tax=Geomicrobium sediminis TaxID=1347788 RepID=A0ABS2PFL5_9BACL|nr:putative PurR-regulated permease PerM [Geomicrobium sediminis]
MIKTERKWMYRVALVLTVLVSLYVLYLLTPVWKPVLVSLFKILIPFMIAGLFAYLLHPVIDYLERQGSPRFLSVFIIYTIFFGGGAWLIVETAPKILEETKELLQTLPTWVRSFNDQLLTIHRQIDTLPPSIHDQIENGVVRLENEGSEMMNGVVDRLPLILEGIAFIFLLPFVTFYFLKDLRALEKAVVFITPKRFRETGEKVAKAADHAFGSYIRGQLLVSICVGVLSVIGLWIAGVPYPIVLGILLGVMDLIPYFGPILGAIPVLIIALTVSWQTALFALVAILIIQQIEGNVLSPMIVGKSAHLHPLIILFALLLGYEFAGVIGLLVAVPLFVIASEIIKVFRHTKGSEQRV